MLHAVRQPWHMQCVCLLEVDRLGVRKLAIALCTWCDALVCAQCACLPSNDPVVILAPNEAKSTRDAN